jgi:hypothetical protein
VRTAATLLFHADCKDDNQDNQDEKESDPAEYSTFLASLHKEGPHWPNEGVK